MELSQDQADKIRTKLEKAIILLEEIITDSRVVAAITFINEANYDLACIDPRFTS